MAFGVFGGLTAGAIAQTDVISPPPTLPSLADPPFLSEALLFESPWPLMAVFAAISLLLAVVIAKRGRMGLAALVAADALVVPAVLFAIATSVETDRERVRGASRELVEAVATADASALSDLLSERTHLALSRLPEVRDKAGIVSWVGSAMRGDYAVEKYTITELQAEQGPESNIAKTRVSVRVVPERTKRNTGFICMLTWGRERDGDEDVWRVIRIEPLWVQGYGELQR